MPYKVKGKIVVKADTGEVVGHSNKPKKYLRVLQAVEHGWKPDKVKGHHSANDGEFLNKRRIKFKVL
jgi:hypothetical protein